MTISLPPVSTKITDNERITRDVAAMETATIEERRRVFLAEDIEDNSSDRAARMLRGETLAPRKTRAVKRQELDAKFVDIQEAKLLQDKRHAALLKEEALCNLRDAIRAA
jgi:hypothetical protein